MGHGTGNKLVHVVASDVFTGKERYLIEEAINSVDEVWLMNQSSILKVGEKQIARSLVKILNKLQEEDSCISE